MHREGQQPEEEEQQLPLQRQNKEVRPESKAKEIIDYPCRTKIKKLGQTQKQDKSMKVFKEQYEWPSYPMIKANFNYQHR